MRDLTQLDILESWLATNKYEYTREDNEATTSSPCDTHQIVVYKDGVRSWDVICHRGSYGCDQGLLEGMGDLFDSDVEGWLTAADVIQRLEEAKQCVIK